MDAGWTRITGAPADETTAWSSWDLPGDSEWRGLLMVLAAFGPSQRQLIIRIQRSGAGDDGYSGYRVLS